MSTRRKKFPTPTKPLSWKSAVKKILAEQDYAEFIHRQVLKARSGDSTAAALVVAHVKPLPTELAALKLRPADFRGTPFCSDTPFFMLIDFAALHKVWKRKR
jgi:hypothetical protein